MSGRAQRILLLGSAASLAFVIGALVLHAWFWVGVGAIVFAATVFAQPWASSRVAETRVVFDNPQQTPKPSTTPLPKSSTTPLPKSSTTPLPKSSTTPLPKSSTTPLPKGAVDEVRVLPVRPSPPPLPPPEDLIPVAPELGLTIRKRPETRNLRPRAKHVIALAPEAGLEIRIREPARTDVAVQMREPDAAVHMREPVERHTIGFDDIDSQSGSFAFSPSATVKDPIPAFARSVSRPVAGTVAPPISARAAMSAQELATLPLSDIAERLGGPTIKYAVTTATLTLAGIEATRRDGSTHMIAWDAITYVVARRLPSEEPFDGATFVDIVSAPGATLRILSSTNLVGMPTHEVGEPRARTLVNLIAARCEHMKLDPATQLFAQHNANAVQLPTLKLLAVHDDRFA